MHISMRRSSNFLFLKTKDNFYLPIPPAPLQLINFVFCFYFYFSSKKWTPHRPYIDLHRPYTDLPTSAFTALSMYYMCTNDLVFSSTDSFSPNANSYSLGSLLTNRNLPHSQKASRNDFHGPLGQALPLPSRAPFFVG